MLNVDFGVAILLVEVIPLVLPPIERLSIIVGELIDIEDNDQHNFNRM